MKLTLLLLILTTISSCSTKKDLVDPNLYLKLNKAHSDKHAQCLSQRKNILDKAITEAQDAELDDENYFFVRNEEKALSFIMALDLNKFTLKENQLETEALINACVTKRDPSYTYCDTLYPAMKYFRGLIYGLRQYRWTPSTRKLAVDQILKYLKYAGESESTLMELVFANDLLMRLANFKYIPPEFFQETVAFRYEGEKVHGDLRGKINKLSKKKLTCEDAKDFHQDERKAVKQLSEKFLVMLRKVN